MMGEKRSKVEDSVTQEYSRTMKISQNWLSDFIDWIETDPAVIADRMTRSMGEVDEVEEQGALMKNCVVGKVLTLAKHPNADKLSMCTVETEQGTKTVVCGGTNVKQGMLVAFAHIGATVKWHGEQTMTLTRVKIRGVESEGMICAGEELGIAALFPAKPEDGERAIVDLTNGKYKVGTPLREALGLTDAVYHIDNHAITNRPDLFSHIGVARELVAMGIARWKKEPVLPKVTFPKTAPSFALKNEVPKVVPYYNGCEITLSSVTASPEWMQRRLIACGSRPINLVVDITNYVLMETGMPLHAFDVSDFRGDLRIRASLKGEKVKTLDGAERTLPEGTIVISDNDGIFDLFGIMGGLRTSAKETTRKIFLQAGIIDPMSVRKTVIQMGHRTDAATVYEKGEMPVTSETGLLRAIELFLELSPGAHVASNRVMWGESDKPKNVTIEAGKLREFIGVAIPEATMKKILSDLGCTVKKSAKDSLSVTTPVWRRDLSHAQDIAEEIARIYGYANIPPAMPDASIEPPARDTRLHAIRDSLSQSGALEMLHLAFTSPAQLKRWNMNPDDAVALENPIGEELSLMRPALLPSLIETAAKELKNIDGSILKVYEAGNVFRKNDEHSGLTFAILARGKTTIKDSPLLIAKSDILRALKAAGYDATVRTGTVPLPGISHEGRSAEIRVGETIVGHLFELHPTLLRSLGLPERTAVATLGLHQLFPLPSSVITTKPLPVFPSVTFDETVSLTGKRSYATLSESLRKIDPLLRQMETVNLYEKEELKTLTLRFTYRADDRTLTQEEVEKVHGKVLLELRK